MMDRLRIPLNMLQSELQNILRNTLQQIQLFTAIIQGNINEATEILNSDTFAISDNSDFDYTYITFALDHRQIEIAKLFVEHGFRVYKENKPNQERTVLHAAVESSDDTEFIATLLEKGASQDILSTNKENKTPFHLAIDREQLAIIQLFLSHCDVKTLEEKSFLHYAVEQDKITLVEEMIKAGFSVCRKNEENLTSICVALINGNFKILLRLLPFCKGENINPDNHNDVAPVYIACMCGYLELIKKYADFGLSLNRQLKLSSETWSCLTNYSKYTLLHLAVKYTKLEVVKFLLSAGADINIQNDDDSSPLHIAFENKEKGIWETWQHFDDNNSIIDLILQANMKMKSNPVNKNRLSHFHVACSRDEPRVVEHFLKNGALINQPTEPQCHLYKGFYPLHFAAKFRCIRTLETLLKNGADVKRRDSKKMTALHIAAKESCLDTVRLLLEYGADIISLDSDGNSPVHLAFKTKNYTVIDLLLSYNQNLHLNPTNGEGLSHFHIACTRDNVGIVKSFIKNGESIDICVPEESDENQDSSVASWAGYSPLHFAVSHNRATIVQLLLKSGATVGSKDSKGYIPLHLACQYKYEMFGEFIKSTLYDFHKHGKVTLELKQVTDITEISENYSNGFSDCTGKFNWTINQGDHMKIINSLLNYKSDVNSIDSNGSTPIFYAYAVVADVKSILEKNMHECSKDLINQIVESLSEELCERRKLILNSLLKLDVNLNNCHQGGSILHYICARDKADERDKEIMQLFLEHGADVNLYNECQVYNMSAPLHVATKAGNENLIRTLLDYGANVECVNFLQYDRTPLLINTFETKSLLTCMNIIGIFIHNGANVNARQSDGMTALHILAMRFNNSHIIKFLIWNLMKAGADINSQDYRGLTPLHLACLKLNFVTANNLLLLGANINIENYERQSVCYYLYETYLKDLSIDDRDKLTTNLKCLIKWLQDHIMKMNVIGLPVNRKELLTYIKFYGFVPRTDQEKLQLIDNYKCEMGSLQVTNINAYCTLYDVIVKNENSLAKFVKNLKFRSMVGSDSFRSTYSHYGCLIQMKYLLGVYRAKLLPKAKWVLKNIIGLDLPDSCSETIFSYFTNCQLSESVEVMSKALNSNSNTKNSTMQLRSGRTHKRQKVY